MSYCTHCGHHVELGRFCTNCGAPLAEQPWRSDTAERELTAILPARPLYADEATAVPAVPAVEPTVVLARTSLAVPLPVPVGVALKPVRRSRGHLLVLLAAAGVVVLLVGLAWLIGRALSGDDSPSGHGSVPSVADDEVVDLTRGASASAPETARPNLDLSGDMVRYEASNLLDGVASTAWRMAGDGSGQTLTITLPGPSVVTRVGLINGYAKVDRAGRHETNWYDRNRRVLEVEWLFDDGTSVVQRFDDTRRMQSLEVGPIATSTIQLRLLIVSPPGDRNYTAISDVLIEGAAAG